MAQTGHWDWYHPPTGRRRLSFSNFVFYRGDHVGDDAESHSPTAPGYWAAEVHHTAAGRAELDLEPDLWDRWFIWRCPTDAVVALLGAPDGLTGQK